MKAFFVVFVQFLLVHNVLNMSFIFLFRSLVIDSTRLGSLADSTRLDLQFLDSYPSLLLGWINAGSPLVPQTAATAANDDADHKPISLSSHSPPPPPRRRSPSPPPTLSARPSLALFKLGGLWWTGSIILFDGFKSKSKKYQNNQQKLRKCV